MIVVTFNEVGPGEFPIVMVVVNVQPFTSFTTTVYVPAANPGYAIVVVNALPFT